MLIDHIGMLFFPYDDMWRIIGRLAFPLFAWGIVRWYKYTKNKEKYAQRLAILAVISQIPLFFISGMQLFNICFTLLAWLYAIAMIDSVKLKWYTKVWGVTWLLYLSYVFNFDYQMYGVLSIIVLYFGWQKKISILYFFILTILFYCINYREWIFHFSIQLYAVFSIMLLYLTPIQKYDFKINFYLKYWFYPIHLSILYIIFLLQK